MCLCVFVCVCVCVCILWRGLSIIRALFLCNSSFLFSTLQKTYNVHNNYVVYFLLSLSLSISLSLSVYGGMGQQPGGMRPGGYPGGPMGNPMAGPPGMQRKTSYPLPIPPWVLIMIIVIAKSCSIRKIRAVPLLHCVSDCIFASFVDAVLWASRPSLGTTRSIQTSGNIWSRNCKNLFVCANIALFSYMN